MEKKVIKFRAWDTVRKMFVDEGEISFCFYGDTRIEVRPNSIVYIRDPIHYGEPQSDRFVIEQFTGLHDREGKEVYEGDLLSAGGGSLVYEVVFQDGGFCFKNELSSGPDRLSKDRVARLSIIGHIHETN